ncbi:diguanylate cyclase [Leptothoe spongobia]|uniref:Diguanylate cyclase n=1 Tax=Leptothoe spongobia TAU-MAC 1115 TaxID=1967444 RepID=A0A947GLC0_9CYAN|nr:diguanylate cyclase [Leptothoe spongobia]MBT9317368.1 diguanylate cyclase [Leptothoe spongobia TAU-MAC 1115]
MSPINVLLIEDNLGDVFLINTFLGQADDTQFKVTHAESLGAALAYIQQACFDLALVDLSLPDSQGIDTLLSLQAKAPHLPTVVVTGLDDAELARQLIWHGAQDYLVKENINRTWLQNTIHHTVARFQRVEDRYQLQKYSRRKLIRRISTYKDKLIDMDEKLKILEKRSSTDMLTQVANRYHFEKTFEQEWLQSYRNQQSLSLIIVDIDFFKQYNDSCGHPQGDACLQKVAQSLEKGLKRPQDLVARYGGEEFVVLLPNTPKQGAIKVATELGVGIKTLAARHPNSSISSWVTASFGVASMVAKTNISPSILLNQADQALYFAKENGRNRIAYFQSSNFVTQTII